MENQRQPEQQENVNQMTGSGVARNVPGFEPGVPVAGSGSPSTLITWEGKNVFSIKKDFYIWEDNQGVN